MNKRLLSFIVSRIPEAADALIPKYVGTHPGHQAVGSVSSYSPIAVGMRVATEVARVGWTAQKLGLDLRPIADWDGELCPPPVFWKGFPFPPPPPGDPEPHPEWESEYLLGFAATLAAASLANPDSAFLEDAAAFAQSALEESLPTR